MKKIADFLVEKRILLLFITLIFAIVSAFLINSVNINKDSTKYLSKDSGMHKGLQIIQEEFPSVELKDSFQIMFEGLTSSEKLKIFNELKAFEGVTDVNYDINSSDYNTKSFTMYIVHTDFSNESNKVNAIIEEMTDSYEDTYNVYSYYSGGSLLVLDLLIPMALSIMLVLLFVMCKSYFEPLLLLISIAVAIVINMGTNIIFESVSDLTFSIAAVFQLVLSIDYSIVLLHRFDQEYQLLGRRNKKQAMKNAIVNAFNSIASSSITTIVGLVVLLLMTFTIGKDIGLVLAKGVLLSLVCVFTVMPALIIKCEKLIYNLNKDNIKKRKALKSEEEYYV